MVDGDRVGETGSPVRELQEQVTAFAGLGQALKEVDGVLGQVTHELASARSERPARGSWAGSHQVRAVALA